MKKIKKIENLVLTNNAKRCNIKDTLLKWLIISICIRKISSQIKEKNKE